MGKTPIPVTPLAQNCAYLALTDAPGSAQEEDRKDVPRDFPPGRWYG